MGSSLVGRKGISTPEVSGMHLWCSVAREPSLLMKLTQFQAGEPDEGEPHTMEGSSETHSDRSVASLTAQLVLTQILAAADGGIAKPPTALTRQVDMHSTVYFPLYLLPWTFARCLWYTLSALIHTFNLLTASLAAP